VPGISFSAAPGHGGDSAGTRCNGSRKPSGFRFSGVLLEDPGKGVITDRHRQSGSDWIADDIERVLLNAFIVAEHVIEISGLPTVCDRDGA